MLEPVFESSLDSGESAPVPSEPCSVEPPFDASSLDVSVEPDTSDPETGSPSPAEPSVIVSSALSEDISDEALFTKEEPPSATSSDCPPPGMVKVDSAQATIGCITGTQPITPAKKTVTPTSFSTYLPLQRCGTEPRENELGSHRSSSDLIRPNDT